MEELTDDRISYNTIIDIVSQMILDILISKGGQASDKSGDLCKSVNS